MSHTSLFAHYKTNFVLMTDHHYSLMDLDSMIPFERDIYIQLLNKKINERNEKLRQG